MLEILMMSVSSSSCLTNPGRLLGTRFPICVIQRAYNPPPRHRSPSPPVSRRYAYNSYVPPRPAPSHREDYPNVYRPNVYRPDANTYYSRSPSPGYPPARTSEPDPRDRGVSRQPASKTPTARSERKPLPPSPTSSIPRDRTRRDSMMATRMFEPSDAWKQTHVDRPHRIDT